MSTTYQQVHQIIGELLDLEETQVSPHAHLREDLGADSLDIVEMIIALAGKFDIAISDDEVSSIGTVGEIATYIEMKAAT